MSFDQPTRNRLARFVSDTRDALSLEFTRQMQHEYGLDPETGEITSLDRLKHLDDTALETAVLLRETLEHYKATSPSGGNKEGIQRIIREQAFTVLNRLCAIRMAEARGLIIESIGKGYQSKGFQLYARVAGTSLGETGDAFRVFLFSLFDEFSVDLPVLFDRFSQQGRLFPRETVLLQVLEQLNNPELESLWSEDETIGWIYQYFNSIEERKQMRAESEAPRNGRELAVRNQFFTPRYVVEFLTDNTLGRIWYEMRKGDTSLKDRCRYLVRRPNEIFLAPSEKAPETEDTGRDLSQQELLRLPVHIEHRPKQDPRGLNILDPAVGSGHFLLYAFDLLELIYEEAWHDPESPKADASGHTLQQDYATIEELRKAIPELIVRWNLHGIDIDPRCAQIAGLALWLRAQRSWHQMGLKPSERPIVKKSNIVVAEPMPGEREMLKEFTAELRPTVLGQLVERVFELMKLAGEAGSLLKIEEEIKSSVAKAKEQWQQRPKAEQEELFHELKCTKVMQGSLFDISGISDETFWGQAEERILIALRDYAERAENGHTLRRRLFAEDASRGFAFIDLCRKRYDVALLNPPYGEPTGMVKQYALTSYEDTHRDLYAAFIERSLHLSRDSGMVGALTSRTWLQNNSFSSLRENLILAQTTIRQIVDLGQGVLDAAMVETCATVFQNSRTTLNSEFIRLNTIADKESALLSRSYDSYCVSQSLFGLIPNSPLVYWLPKHLYKHLLKGISISNYASIKQGLGTGDDFRFIRSWWEVPASNIKSKEWIWLSKGGEYSQWFFSIHLVVNWKDDGRAIRNLKDTQGRELSRYRGADQYFEAGLTYPFRSTKGFNVRVLPKGCIFTIQGPSICSKVIDHRLLLAYLNSYLSQTFLESFTSGGAWQVGYVQSIPYFEPPDSSTVESIIGKIQRIVTDLQILESFSEVSPYFTLASLPSDSISNSIQGWRTLVESSQSEIAGIKTEIDGIYAELVGVELPELINLYQGARQSEHVGASADDPGAPGQVGSANESTGSHIAGIIEYITGCLFGRWDVRIALCPSLAPKLPDPFEPLPVSPPGMLVGADGLPAESDGIVSEAWQRSRLSANSLPSEGSVKDPLIPDDDYPLRVCWKGILVDDAGPDRSQPHQDDIIRLIREASDLIWSDRAHEIEQEVCDILGVSDMRDYFNKPTGFFQNHLNRYSKSRRKAPIYWPLSTASGSYTIWFYYHRLTDQTLYIAVNEYVEPKLKQISDDLTRIRTKTTRTRQEEKQLEQLSDLELELGDFRSELLKVAAVWKPNLNDGVQITAAPLWKFFQNNQWRTLLRETWESLVAGEYDWAHLAYSQWPERVREKCKSDKSLAIAHGLEELYEGPKAEPKKSRGRKKKAIAEEIVDED